jgi:dTDP-4-amino-4,6-dideoxygalactose transaminase
MAQLAIHGGAPVKSTPFPAWPHYDADEREALLGVLDSRVWWRTPGTQTAAFEAAFAAYHGVPHGIAVTNGTAALEVAMDALGIGPGDEVIVPDFTFVATAAAVLNAGAMPVPVDVSADTFCLDPDLAEAAITPRTKAIAVVHMAGHPADMDRFGAIASRHGLALIEDAAHAHGSEWKGQKVGSMGALGTFSFQQSKLMTAGEGGIVISALDAVAARARSAHDCGRKPGEWFYAHFNNGSNYRMTEWQGAILRRQLARFDAQATVRTRNASRLRNDLGAISGITPQALDSRCTRHGYYAFIFHYDRGAFGGRPTEDFIRALNAEGIPTQASYPPIHALDVFTSGAYRSRLAMPERNAPHAFLRSPFPETARAAHETVWLPNPVLLGSDEEMTQTVEAVEKVRGAFGGV